MKKSGLIAKICTGGFFVVRYQNDDCAAFSSSYFVNLSEGDQVLAELDKVGSMVMLDEERNAAFEVFAHTGRSCLIECLILIEDLLAAAAVEENAPLMFYGESEHTTRNDANETSALHSFTKPRQAVDLEL